MKDGAIHSVFVYGTLKRGQLRESVWPYAPKRVSRATTVGTLYDLGPYPALMSGDDVVAGELWTFEQAQMPHTLRVLDDVEDFRNEPNDMYKRVVIEIQLPGGECVHAYAYHFATELDESLRIAPGTNGTAQWPSP